jgi:hypothetical protein
MIMFINRALEPYYEVSHRLTKNWWNFWKKKRKGFVASHSFYSF